MKRNFLSIIPRYFLVLFVIALGGLTACKEKTAAEKGAEEITKMRELKRVNAIKYYKLLALEYPTHPKAGDATSEAARLEAAAPKK